MTWSYSGDSKSSNKDNVRFILGDTTAEMPLLTDEEINAVLQDREHNVLLAAYDCCERILAKLATQVDIKLGPQSIQASQRFKHYQQLQEKLANRIKAYYAAPSGSPMETTTTTFNIGMMDNEEANSWMDKLNGY